ncbi:MAG: hypothetical protein IT581_23765 [Verrucomicrobiales bacterium]|nr:hypothetical protein [Verrucomicrobiales bacterium]
MRESTGRVNVATKVNIAHGIFRFASSSLPGLTSLLFLFLFPARLHAAEITIEGLTDRTVYPDQVTFRIVPPTDTPLVATLDGAPVPVDQPVIVANPDFHELLVEPNPPSPAAPPIRRVRFIVRATERGDSEWGLPPWTPPAVVNASTEELAGARVQWLMPARYPALRPIPFAVRLEDANGNMLRLHARLESTWHEPLQIRRGSGAGTMSAPGELAAGATEYHTHLPGSDLQRPITLEIDTVWTKVGGPLAGETAWPDNARIQLTNSISVPLGATLRVARGAIISIGPGLDITVRGAVIMEGSAEEPIVFAPAESARPWGGFLLFGTNASLRATHALFIGSGANPSWFSQNSGYSVHRSEQALFLIDGARVELSRCSAFDGAGQFGHGKEGFLTLDRCLVQRFITGGEYNGGSVQIRGSALLEFPVDDGIFDDADNDAIYFTSGRHEVSDSVIGWAKDDGIDAGSGGSGSVLATNVWVEGNFHEAFAWSGGGRSVTNLDCVALHCGQGIECGWSTGDNSPRVNADHCLLLGNATGFRFGDNYDWTYTGVLHASNSIALFNHRDVFDLNWDDWTNRPAQMDLRGNWFSQIQPRYPDNATWNADTDAARLAPFLPRPAAARVGLAFATRSPGGTLDQLTRGLPVGLSTFSTRPVSVEYAIETPGTGLTNGVLRFLPGETVKPISLPPSAVPSHAVVRIQLSDPQGAELTGPSSLYLAGEDSQTVTLIPRGSRWRYFDNGTDPGPTWASPTFDDGTWKEGAARLGFGGDGEVTVIQGGPSNARFAAAYFRHSLTVPDPSIFEEIEVRLQRDDGGIVHLNGTEVFRSNLPAGTVTSTTYTGSGTDSETDFYTTQFPATGLRAGTNMVAVEVHQANATSSDLGFDLELVGRPASRLAWHRFNDRVLLTWNSASSQGLQSSTNLSGPWTEVAFANGLYEVRGGPIQFYRLRRPTSTP